MQVLDFMNAHSNWEELLIQEPYNIIIKRDGDYILLKYNQLGSDFSLPIVRECRGSIFYLNEDGIYECVCRAFDKFGNVHESYIPTIDWNSAAVEEKIDGSLIKVWYHNGKWHVSTNGTIDAYKAEVDDEGYTFGSLFDEALRDTDIWDSFNKNMVYMFELVSPKSRVTIPYPETKLYFLGNRDMRTMRESKDYDAAMLMNGISQPKTYALCTLDECLEYAMHMTKDEEGFVVRDKNFNRVKIKSPQYLIASHLNNNGAITTKRIINMMKNNMLDDFLAYCSEYQDKVQAVIDDLNSIARTLESSWDQVADNARTGNRKEFAKLVRSYSNNDYLFAKYDNPELHAFDWITSCRTACIRRMLKQHKKRMEE